MAIFNSDSPQSFPPSPPYLRQGHKSGTSSIITSPTYTIDNDSFSSTRPHIMGHPGARHLPVEVVAATSISPAIQITADSSLHQRLLLIDTPDPRSSQSLVGRLTVVRPSSDNVIVVEGRHTTPDGTTQTSVEAIYQVVDSTGRTRASPNSNAVAATSSGTSNSASPTREIHRAERMSISSTNPLRDQRRKSTPAATSAAESNNLVSRPVAIAKSRVSSLRPTNRQMPSSREVFEAGPAYTNEGSLIARRPSNLLIIDANTVAAAANENVNENPVELNLSDSYYDDPGYDLINAEIDSLFCRSFDMDMLPDAPERKIAHYNIGVKDVPRRSPTPTSTPTKLTDTSPAPVHTIPPLYPENTGTTAATAPAATAPAATAPAEGQLQKHTKLQPQPQQQQQHSEFYHRMLAIRANAIKSGDIFVPSMLPLPPPVRHVGFSHDSLLLSSDSGQQKTPPPQQASEKPQLIPKKPSATSKQSSEKTLPQAQQPISKAKAAVEAGSSEAPVELESITVPHSTAQKPNTHISNSVASEHCCGLQAGCPPIILSQRHLTMPATRSKPGDRASSSRKSDRRSFSTAVSDFVFGSSSSSRRHALAHSASTANAAAANANTDSGYVTSTAQIHGAVQVIPRVSSTRSRQVRSEISEVHRRNPEPNEKQRQHQAQAQKKQKQKQKKQSGLNKTSDRRPGARIEQYRDQRRVSYEETNEPHCSSWRCKGWWCTSDSEQNRGAHHNWLHEHGDVQSPPVSPSQLRNSGEGGGNSSSNVFHSITSSWGHIYRPHSHAVAQLVCSYPTQNIKRAIAVSDIEKFKGALLFKDGKQTTCEVVLITPSAGFVAANCLEYTKDANLNTNTNYQVYVDEANGNDTPTIHQVNVNDIHVHEYYNPSNHMNNIAIIEFNKDRDNACDSGTRWVNYYTYLSNYMSFAAKTLGHPIDTYFNANYQSYTNTDVFPNQFNQPTDVDLTGTVQVGGDLYARQAAQDSPNSRPSSLKSTSTDKGTPASATLSSDKSVPSNIDNMKTDVDNKSTKTSATNSSGKGNDNGDGNGNANSRGGNTGNNNKIDDEDEDSAVKNLGHNADGNTDNTAELAGVDDDFATNSAEESESAKVSKYSGDSGLTHEQKIVIFTVVPIDDAASDTDSLTIPSSEAGSENKPDDDHDDDHDDEDVEPRKKLAGAVPQSSLSETNETQAEAKDTAGSELAIDKSVFLRKFTENALQQVKEGNPDEYHKLIKVFSYSRTALNITPEKYVEEVTPWISALSANVSALSLAYRELVTTIFFSDWIFCNDEKFVHRYSTLILQVLSAHPAWIPQAMPALVRWFVYGGHQSDNKVLAPLIHDRLHNLVKEIYRTIPTCGPSLAAAMAEACPFKAVKANIQVLFLQNVLRTLEYASGMQREVLKMVLNHIIQIDVEVQVELEELESEDEEEGEGEGEGEIDLANIPDEEGIFHFEEDEPAVPAKKEEKEAGDSGSESGSDSDSDSGSESESGSEDSDLDDGTEMEKARYSAKKTVAKLDAIMSTVLVWLEKHCEPDAETGELPESTSKIFLQFLDLFATIVLPTFKSRYTQFLLFYLCAKDTQYADVFLGTMMGNVGEPVRKTMSQSRVSNVEKLAAASYLGSFVARAKFLSASIVRNVVGVLVQWSNVYLDWYEEQQQKQAAAQETAVSGRQRSKSYSSQLQLNGGRTGSSSGSLYSEFERHAVFYAVTQAALYMFCFRWRDLAEAAEGGPVVETELDGLRWCPEVEGIQRVVFSKLNPLRACASAVAQQFALVASQTNFMFCYSVLQQNRRKNQQEGEVSSSASGAVTTSPDQVLRSELDTFFPFDPMTLPISRHYIDNIYLDWQDVGAVASNDEDSEGSDAEGNGNVLGEEDDDENEAGVVGQMISMSISPIQPLSALPGRTFE
ncbi:DNA independent RNA polymerase I transcription factor [Coemansia sp. Benny D115]|nr:DNA independent RNA polymerase I transcription factor [Coemansia sp. Benny D115]